MSKAWVVLRRSKNKICEVFYLYMRLESLENIPAIVEAMVQTGMNTKIIWKIVRQSIMLCWRRPDSERGKMSKAWVV